MIGEIAHVSIIKKKPSSQKKNFTNKGWRKASNIISPLFTYKGYTCDD